MTSQCPAGSAPPASAQQWPTSAGPERSPNSAEALHGHSAAVSVLRGTSAARPAGCRHRSLIQCVITRLKTVRIETMHHGGGGDFGQMAAADRRLGLRRAGGGQFHAAVRGHKPRPRADPGAGKLGRYGEMEGVTLGRLLLACCVGSPGSVTELPETCYVLLCVM